MDIGKELLLREAAAAGIPEEQAGLLWNRLATATEAQPKFDTLNVAYYFGGLIIIGAMTFFFGLAWERVGGAGILALALAYGCVFGGLGGYLFHVRKLYVAGGLLTTVAVSMAPLAVYGLERALKLWPEGASGSYLDVSVKASRFYMEIGTLAAWGRGPALRAFSLSDPPRLRSPCGSCRWTSRRCCLAGRHLQPTALGFRGLRPGDVSGGLLDRPADYGRLCVLVISLWCSVILDRTLFDGQHGPWPKFACCLVNIGILAVSTFLDRRVFAVFGSLGVAGYLSYLAFTLFKDSLLLPVALTAIGLAVIAAAIAYQKNRARVDALIIGILPAGLRRLSPADRK